MALPQLLRNARTHSTQPHLDADQLVTVLERLADRATEWKSLARFDCEGRWWRRLYGNDSADIWLLGWLTGQGTELHDHGGSAGAFTVIEGALTEVRAVPDVPLETRTTVVTSGTSVAISPSTVHDVYNAGPAAAVSLHAYSPPLSSMSFYAQHPSGLARLRTVSTRDESKSADLGAISA